MCVWGGGGGGRELEKGWGYLEDKYISPRRHYICLRFSITRDNIIEHTCTAVDLTAACCSQSFQFHRNGL